MTIYLFQYNNYYNRQVKGFNTIAEYPDPLDILPYTKYIPNDGYETRILLNTHADEADYLIIVDEDNNITSRWFVMEAIREREGQYTFYVQRDIVYDFKDDIVNAPCFIEKAMLDATNPLIYNKEDFSANQIKTKELLLKDKLGMPWIVAYIKKQTAKTINMAKQEFTVDYTLNTLDEYEWYANRNTLKSNIMNEKIIFQFYQHHIGLDYIGYYTFDCAFDANGQPVNPGIGDSFVGIHDFPYGTSYRVGNHGGYKADNNKPYTRQSEYCRQALNKAKTISWKSIRFSDYVFPDDAGYTYDPDDFWNEADKVIFESSTGKYYRIKVKQIGPNNKQVTIEKDSALGIKLDEIANAVDTLSASKYDDPIGYVSVDYISYQISFEEIPTSALVFDIPGVRRHTENTPYDILAIPVGTYNINFKVEGALDRTGRATSEDQAFNLAAALSENLGEDLVDIQYLPYCPLSENFIDGYKDIDLGELDYTKYAALVMTDAQAFDPQAIGFFVEQEDFTVNLLTENESGTLVPVEIDVPEDAIEFKIMNETTEYRIVSPNYASVFSISAAKNKGLKNLRADCTYKPFNPYIRVYPEYNGLYGANFGDNRGMIISGDFGLPRTTNEWVNYQLQNKNFLNIFDRDIDNLEVNNRLARKEAMANIVTGTVSGAATGGLIGSNIGGGVGAGIGAGVGAAASLAGGIVDYDILKQRQAETLDYKNDMFGYQLGNIKARHSAVAKVSAFDINSKIWPFIEVYDCTEVEKEALRQKLLWNSMTVMTIGNIGTYIKSEPTYIKGRLIRLEIPADYMITTHIAEEINKGVYI